MLRVTDTGTRTERLTRSESVVVPVGKQPGAGFTKVVPARPGFGIVAAGIAAPTLPGVRNPHVHVAADRRTATVAGEWAVGSKDVARAVGGSDLIVPVTLTEERTVAVPAAATVVTGPFIEFGLLGGASLPLPVPPRGWPARHAT